MTIFSQWECFYFSVEQIYTGIFFIGLGTVLFAKLLHWSNIYWAFKYYKMYIEKVYEAMRTKIDISIYCCWKIHFAHHPFFIHRVTRTYLISDYFHPCWWMRAVDFFIWAINFNQNLPENVQSVPAWQNPLRKDAVFCRGHLGSCHTTLEALKGRIVGAL